MDSQGPTRGRGRPPGSKNKKGTKPPKPRPKPPKRPRRRTPDYTEEQIKAGARPFWWEAYIQAYAETGIKLYAARKARIDPETPRQYLENHPQLKAEFDERMMDADEQSRDALKLEVWRRGHNGVLKPIYQGGKKVGTIREYSDSLLMFHTKMKMPEYRESYRVEHAGTITIDTLLADTEEPRPGEEEPRVDSGELDGED